MCFVFAATGVLNILKVTGHFSKGFSSFGSLTASAKTDAEVKDGLIFLCSHRRMFRGSHLFFADDIKTLVYI